MPRRYEVPDIQFEKLAVRFMDIRKRVYDVSRTSGRACTAVGGGRACTSVGGGKA